MRHRHERPLSATAGRQAIVLRLEIRPFTACRSMGRFHQGLAQPDIPVLGTTALSLPRALVVARAEAHPRSQLSGGWKAGHIRANLRENDLGHPSTHARNVV